MTANVPFTRIATFHARAGQADRLVAGVIMDLVDRPPEEIYVVLSGSGLMKVDDDRFELRSLDAVRVAPGSTRELAAGAEGIEVLAFGLHSPGDGEMVTDWSAP
jgi:mannose-6-phosphate isomerase-like protein (cupin superfamily)